MEPGWDDDDLTPPSRRSPLMAVVAVLLVVALVGGAVVIAFDRTTDGPERPELAVRPDLPPKPEGPPPTEEQLDDVVAELSAFVAEVRKLEFKRPVPVNLLPDEQFAARVRADAVEDVAELDETERVLQAVGLLDPDIDLATVLTSFLGEGVVGFYDPETGELVLRGAALTPYVRATLAHELTHALDDQHFELDRPDLDEADDERGYAFSALVEGNAVRVEEAYKDTFSGGEREEFDAEEARLGMGLDLSAVPPVLPQLIGFPYSFGPPMLQKILDRGGEAAVDQAFATPPATTEQVLDPDAWLDRNDHTEPVSVPPPAAGGEVFDQGVLGLWGIVLLLSTEVPQREAVRAAEGWGGDWYVAWADGDRTCVRNTLVMDTGDDLRELAGALEEWAAGQEDAEVDRGDGQVTYTACR